MLGEDLRLAELSYKDPSEFRNFHPNALFYDSSENGHECTQFYFIEEDEEIIIVFRGSSSKSDFWADADFFLDPVPYSVTRDEDVKVHGGFLRQFLAALPTLILRIEKAPKHWPVRVIGHSLGGALATICAVSLKRGELCVSDRNVSCVTFGSPRVGNSSFAKAFNQCVNTSVRCVNGRDAVTMRPYWGYEHVSGLKQIGSNTIYGLFSGWFGSVKDHSLESYTTSII